MRLLVALLFAICALAQTTFPPSGGGLPVCSATVTTNCQTGPNGSGVTIVPGTLSVGNTLRTPLVNKFNFYAAFGDSIGTGSDATNPTVNGNVALLGTAIGLTPTNYSVAGVEAADQVVYVYEQTVSETSGQLYTTALTSNNGFYDLNINQQTNYLWTIQALQAWLAIPEALKTRGQAAATTGTWTNSSYYGGAVSLVSTTNGSTATFTTLGTVAYLAFTMQDSNGGTFTLAVDGSTVGTYASQGFNGGIISTGNFGLTYTSALIRVPNLANGAHTLVVTVTSATGGGNQVWVDWAAGNAGTRTFGGPTVIAGGIPRCGTNGSFPAALTDAKVYLFSGYVRTDAEQLAADGLNVIYSDVPNYINPATDFTDSNLHGNNLFHQHIFWANLAAIGPLPGAFPPVPPTGTTALPQVVASFDAVNKYANISDTSMYVVPVNSTGLYSFECYIVTTQAATTSSTMPYCQAQYNDPDTGTQLGPWVTPSSTANVKGISSLTAGASGTNGSAPFSAVAGSSINYATASYASSPNPSGAIVWAASTAYADNVITVDPSYHVQKVTSNGTSGTSQPTWNDSGSTTTDGTVTWTDQGRILTYAVHIRLVYWPCPTGSTCVN